MKAKVDPTLAPETIWLLLHEGEGGSHVWCDQPDPSGNGEHDAVEYVRSDLVRAMNVRRLLQLRGLAEPCVPGSTGFEMGSSSGEADEKPSDIKG
jgi:hypothetical protein